MLFLLASRQNSLLTKDKVRFKNMSFLERCVKMASKTTLFKGLKIMTFLALSVAVALEYSVDIFTKFHNHATTFTTKDVVATSFTMPPVTFCMQNGLKPSVLKKYGLMTTLDYIGSKSIEQMSSVWDSFVEGSYIINRDFSIYADYFNLKDESIILANGNNVGELKNGDPINIVVHQYHTSLAGTCYQILSNVSVTPPRWITLSLFFNESLKMSDFPQVC